MIEHGISAAEWPAGAKTPPTVLAKPAMNPKHATGQKTTGTTDVVGAEYRKPPTTETRSFNTETRYHQTVAGVVVAV